MTKVSKNFTGPCFVLKCDIKKFFYSVDHQILTGIIERKISGINTLALLQEIIGSFGIETEHENIQMELFDFRGENRERVPFNCAQDKREQHLASSGKGIPIGNLTSQLFANIYMNEFDQFVKHIYKVKYYCRYTDDFVIVSEKQEYLENLLPKIKIFLKNELKLALHPNKISIRKVWQGIDFLGYVVLPHYRKVRTKTKNRIFKKLKQRVCAYRAGKTSEKSLFQSLNSYLGVFSHANAYKIEQELKGEFKVWIQ